MDQIELIEHASAAAANVVANVTPDQMTNATPCADFDLRALLTHFIGALNVQAEAAETGKASLPTGDILGDDPATTFHAAQQRLVTAWRKPGVLDETLELPWGTFPASMYAGMVLTESILHGWDVAEATGQALDVDPEAAQAALDYLKPLDAMLRQPQVYADRVEVGEGASALEKLVAFSGRTP